MDPFYGHGVQVVPTLAALSSHNHQIRVLQNSQMLHHAAAAYFRKPLADFLRGQGVVAQRIQHPASDGRGEGAKGLVILSVF